MAQELKAHKTYDECGALRYYDVREVDAVLTEKDEEIRRLKRALWLARATHNRDLRTLGNFRKYVESNTKKKFSIYSYPTQGYPSTYLHKRMMEAFKTWCESLKLAEDKCRAKAEEYK